MLWDESVWVDGLVCWYGVGLQARKNTNTDTTPDPRARRAHLLEELRPVGDDERHRRQHQQPRGAHRRQVRLVHRRLDRARHPLLLPHELVRGLLPLRRRRWGVALLLLGSGLVVVLLLVMLVHHLRRRLVMPMVMLGMHMRMRMHPPNNTHRLRISRCGVYSIGGGGGVVRGLLRGLLRGEEAFEVVAPRDELHVPALLRVVDCVGCGLYIRVGGWVE